MAAGPRFLTTMQIPILTGREIDDRDRPGSTPVAVISERLARTYFGNENPVGRRITFRTRSAISKSSACRVTCGTVV
jgi:macrolide transport system ATP-binding/permease protein